jgi:predicted N-formylglutamate amidohydrolase
VNVIRWVVTCEHAGNRVPAEYQSLFGGAEDVLNSHRGWDPGAAELTDFLAPLADWSARHDVTRLLVEINRSRHHPRLFSEFSRKLPLSERERILGLYYAPHRTRVEARIAAFLARGAEVVHVAVHTFTPELEGEVRNCDVGILYDPARRCEVGLARRWKTLIEARESGWRVRFNYPYRGAADGFTTHLRRRFPVGYAGLELEVNQALFRGGNEGWDPALVRGLEVSVEGLKADPPGADVAC